MYSGKDDFEEKTPPIPTGNKQHVKLENAQATFRPHARPKDETILIGCTHVSQYGVRFSAVPGIHVVHDLCVSSLVESLAATKSICSAGTATQGGNLSLTLWALLAVLRDISLSPTASSNAEITSLSSQGCSPCAAMPRTTGTGAHADPVYEGRLRRSRSSRC